jgi:hypothetical protein
LLPVPISVAEPVRGAGLVDCAFGKLAELGDGEAFVTGDQAGS